MYTAGLQRHVRSTGAGPAGAHHLLQQSEGQDDHVESQSPLEQAGQEVRTQGVQEGTSVCGYQGKVLLLLLLLFFDYTI